MRPVTDWERWSRGSNLGQSAFVGENPQPGAWIQFHLSTDAAEAAGAGIPVRISDSGGTLVRAFRHEEPRAGINRAIWNLQWTGADPIPGQQGPGGGGFFGPQGPPAMPGMYTATIEVNGQELSTDFELRGDPVVAASQADYEARFAAAMRARDLQTRINRMIGTMDDLDGQIDGLLESIGGKGLSNEDQIRSTAGEAKDQLSTLGAEVRRPPGSMNYRDWPRLLEQLRFVVGGIQGPQAKPTEGQLEVLSDIESAAAARADELSEIVNGIIVELNAMLADAPKIITDWRRTIS